MSTRIIAHLDMDAFFAQIEERDNPRYKGAPIAVGADPKKGLGRGVVATANYKAREYGIHSAMPISTAWKLSQIAIKKSSPEVVFLPPNFPQYGKVSQHINEILFEHVKTIEQASIDEFYFDLSFCGSFSNAFALCVLIKQKIRTHEELGCTVGIGPNKLIAKLISSLYKPDGLKILECSQVQSFLDPLPIRCIPGVGPKTEENLHKRKIFTISDLRTAKKEHLILWYGKWGEDLYRKARGEDSSDVTTDRQIKSISEEETFDEDSLNASFLLDALSHLSKRVIERMKGEMIGHFKTVGIKIRFSDFTTKTRAHTLKEKATDVKTLQREVQKLFLPFLDSRENPKKKRVRLIGVKIENFDVREIETQKPVQQGLFE